MGNLNIYNSCGFLAKSIIDGLRAKFRAEVLRMAFYFPIYSSIVLLYLILLLALIPFLYNQLDGNWALNYNTPRVFDFWQP
jgi:hypothetical protein